MKQLLLIILMCLTSVTLVNAQTIDFSGHVVDDHSSPLPGATIKDADGKAIGVTDNNGKFSVKVKQGSPVTFVFLGFKDEVVRAVKKSTRVIMSEDSKMMSQVVVNGYQQSDIRKTTGSVGILSAEDLKDQPLANVDQLMQGKLSGVNVSSVNGRPGASAKIRIRGISSITGNNEPLWVVDGVPIQKEIPAMGSTYVRSGDFSTLYANGVAGIAPQNIESITVLKDAAAAAIYGSQAQAGVIVITTKKGKEGRMRIDYNASLSVQTSPTRSDNLMNSAEKIAYERGIWNEFCADAYANGTYYPRIGIVGQVLSGYGQYAGMTTEEQEAYLSSLSSQSTNWFNELFRNSLSTGHNISISGGGDKTQYYVGAGINTNNGIVKRTSSDSYNFMMKLSGQPLSRVSYNLSIDFNYLKSTGSSYGFDIFKYAYFANPYEKVYNEDGTYASDNTYFSMPQANGSVSSLMPSNGFNVMREVNETSNTATSATTSLRADVSWNVTDDFRLFGLASFTSSSDVSENIVGQDTYAAWLDRPFDTYVYNSKRIYGNYTNAQTANRNWLLRAQANYSHLFNGLHRVSAVAGTEVRRSMADAVFQKQYGYDPVTGNHNTPLLVIPSTQSEYTQANMETYRSILNSCAGQNKSENAFASFYGAADYIYNNRYVFNATVRSDGSNNFGSAEQFNLTWSTGVAWNIDEESWMKSLRPYLSRATVRISTGVTGGVNKSVYPVLIMNYSTSYRESDTEAMRLGYINNAPNEHLRWERTHDLNGSIDLGFMDDRYNLNVSLYRRKGTDLVTPVRIVSTTGFTTQSFNTSEQLNQGIEIGIGAGIIRTKEWRWNMNANIAYNYNKLTKYQSPTGSVLGDIYVNYPLGKLFTGICNGIDPETGLYTFQLRSDAVIETAADKRNMDNYMFYVGTSNAPWTGGMSTSVSWKNFTLSIAGSYQLKAILSNSISPQTYYSQLSKSMTNTIPTTKNDLYTAHLNVVRDMADRWTPTNTDAQYPRLIDAYGKALNLTTESVTSSFITECVYYEKCSFFKLNSLTLSYSMPDDLVRHTPFTNVGFSFTANNLFYLTNYTGLNPETPGAVYPISRSFTFGINVGL